MTEIIFEKYLFDFFCVVHISSANMEEAGFMTYSAANHQVAD